MRFRTLIVDDEPLAVQRMKRMLAIHEDVVEIIGSAADGEQALDMIQNHQPELVFLDIQMPIMNGFEVLERLDTPPFIIFCTAYDEFALQAFETISIDYLLKPVTPERLATALNKLTRLTRGQNNHSSLQLEMLLSQIRQEHVTRLKVTVGDSVLFLNLDEIYFFRASDKYVEVCLYDKVHLLSKSVHELETELPKEDFVRIHRSTIVNLNHVEKAVRWFGGRYKIRMNDKHKTDLDVSRSAKGRLGL